MLETTFRRDLRLARFENSQVEEFTKATGVSVVLDRTMSDDTDGGRGWQVDYVWITRFLEGPKSKYVVSVETYTPGGYMDPPDYDSMDVAETTNLAEALFRAKMQIELDAFQNDRY